MDHLDVGLMTRLRVKFSVSVCGCRYAFSYLAQITPMTFSREACDDPQLLMSHGNSLG